MQLLMKVSSVFQSSLQMFALSSYAKNNGRKRKFFPLLKFNVREGHFPSMLILGVVS